MKTVKDISATIFGILYPWVKFYIVYFWKNFRVFVDVYDFVKISFKKFPPYCRYKPYQFK